MSFDYIENKEKENLITTTILDKEQYYNDLMYIEDSWTGRLDAQIANTFILEAVQLIVNLLNIMVLKLQRFAVPRI